MINEPPPFEGLHIRIPIIKRGGGFINQGSALGRSTGFVKNCWKASPSALHPAFVLELPLLGLGYGGFPRLGVPFWE